MRRLLAGMLLLVIGSFAFAPAAKAAEIPPTAACTKLAKEIFKDFSGEKYQRMNKKQRKKVDDEIANRLFEANCVSDIEPLLKKVPLKPFSEECEAAAKSADDYWNAWGKELRPIVKKALKATKPVRIRKQNVIQRIRTLRNRGASAKRMAPLVRLRKALARKEQRIARPYMREMFKTMRTYGFNSYVILTELISLRCISKNTVDPEKMKGPAAKVLEKHALTIFFAVIWLIDNDDVVITTVRSDSSGASASSTSSSTDPKLPLMDLP